jgi:hypothetical protein
MSNQVYAPINGVDVSKFKVSLRLLEDILATKAPTPEMAEEETEDIKLEEKGKTIFMRDDKGLYILNYLVLGFLKEASESVFKQLDIKQMKSKITKFCFIRPRKIHFLLEGTDDVIQQADGTLSRPIKCQTMQGPRVSIANSEYIKAGSELEFEINMIEPNGEIKEETLQTLLQFGQFKGLGQFRNGTYGSFELLDFQRVTPKPTRKLAEAKPKKGKKGEEVKPEETED